MMEEMITLSLENGPDKLKICEYDICQTILSFSYEGVEVVEKA